MKNTHTFHSPSANRIIEKIIDLPCSFCSATLHSDGKEFLVQFQLEFVETIPSNSGRNKNQRVVQFKICVYEPGDSMKFCSI